MGHPQGLRNTTVERRVTRRGRNKWVLQEFQSPGQMAWLPSEHVPCPRKGVGEYSSWVRAMSPSVHRGAGPSRGTGLGSRRGCQVRPCGAGSEGPAPFVFDEQGSVDS